MMAGFDYATGDYVITLDGDLQNNASDIPAMVELLENGNLRFGGRETTKKKRFFHQNHSFKNCRISSSKNLQNSIFLTKVVR